MNLKILFILSILFFITTLNAEANIQFEDITQASGISYKGVSWGASWGDFNGDGLPDLWTSNHGQNPSLFQNNGDGTFTDVSIEKILDSSKGKDPHGGSWADFDNDGDQDLIILTGADRGQGEGPNFLLINNEGFLQNKAVDLGLDYPLGRGRTPLWLDFDKDGLLDVILTNFPRPDGKGPTAIFQQTSSGFQDVTESSGIKFMTKAGSASAQISDLIPEKNFELVFLTPAPEGIYDINHFPFKQIPDNMNLPKLFSLDLAIADFNGDLIQDIFLSRMAGESTTEKEESEFYLEDKFLINTGTEFIDKTFSSGFNEPTACRSVVAGDFDNDMDLDIYLVCTLYTHNLSNLLFENQGDGTFIHVSNAGGAEGTHLGIGDSVTTVDYNSDGFLDLFVTNGFGPMTSQEEPGPYQLFKNMGNDNQWIEIDLIGSRSNFNGIGTRVILESGEIKQVREQTGGMHYRSQNHQRLHFGLGENQIINSIIFFWPSGIVHMIENIDTNQILQITEPSSPIPPKQQTSLGIKANDVLCKDSFSLILKASNQMAACVKSSSVNYLFERGWGIAIPS